MCRILLSVLLFFAFSALEAAKRQFQTGNLIEVTTATTVVDGTTHQYAIFVVETRGQIYKGSLPISVVVSGQPVSDLVVGNPLEVSIENAGTEQAEMIIRKPSGKEIKTKITQQPCTSFTVVTRDKLGNVKEGLSADDVKWFQNGIAKEFPGVCYKAPAPTVPVVFFITVTPDVYHGTRVVQNQSAQSNPVSGTVTDQSGNTSQVNGTVETTTTRSTAVPYSVEYGIYTLSVERRRSDGQFDVAHRFQQKGLYNTLYGIPLGGKGHHPVHAVIEDAAKWVSRGGLADATQSVLGAPLK